MLIVGRMLRFVLLVALVVGAIYVWQHRPGLDNPQVPGLKVVTINPSLP
jgi:hypothetical protein